MGFLCFKLLRDRRLAARSLHVAGAAFGQGIFQLVKGLSSLPSGWRAKAVISHDVSIKLYYKYDRLIVLL